MRQMTRSRAKSHAVAARQNRRWTIVAVGITLIWMLMIAAPVKAQEGDMIISLAIPISVIFNILPITLILVT